MFRSSLDLILFQGSVFKLELFCNYQLEIIFWIGAPLFRWPLVGQSFLDRFFLDPLNMGSFFIFLNENFNLSFKKKKKKVFLGSVAYRSYRSLNTMDKQMELAAFYVLPLPQRWRVFGPSLHCPLASGGWAFVLNEVGVHCCLPNKIEDWLIDALGGWNLKGKAKIFWNCAAKDLPWGE